MRGFPSDFGEPLHAIRVAQLHHGFLAMLIPWFLFSLIVLGVLLHQSEMTLNKEVITVSVIVGILAVLVLLFIPRENKKIALVIFENGLYCRRLLLKKHRYFIFWNEVQEISMEKLNTSRSNDFFLKIYLQDFQVFYKDLSFIDKLKYSPRTDVQIHNGGLAIKVLGVLDVAEDVLLVLTQRAKAKYDLKNNG